jgi:threonine dehydrogenase-like Zn-dependent dehydrogenase
VGPDAVGSENQKFKVGDRVVVPFTIARGECGFFSACERSSPCASNSEETVGHSPAGAFGYSHILGGSAGGQAGSMRVPFADVGPLKIPNG